MANVFIITNVYCLVAQDSMFYGKAKTIDDLLSDTSGMLRKAMVAYTKPQQVNKEESERLRGEGDQIEFIDLRFERWQVVGLRNARRRQGVP